ncbi:MAG TPA: O-acetyl-ADP-ribose deacetylase [Anaerolineae bacterium]|nr:O-acetyl-ADP-ribose deacetylase [Anaerolineae bacterium]
MRAELGAAVIELAEGDITLQDTDAIVNAANCTLLGGGGVDGAIHSAGGPAILAECRKLGGCDTGDAKITTGGRLRARHVIHTVGPIYDPHALERSASLLAQAYRRSLETASENGLHSIAFPSISTGAFGYPVEPAARVALAAVIGFLCSAAPTSIRLVRFVLFESRSLRAYEQALCEHLAAQREHKNQECESCR